MIYIYSHTANAQTLVAVPRNLGNAGSECSLHIMNTMSPSGVNEGTLIVLLWMNAGSTFLHSDSNASFMSANYD